MRYERDRREAILQSASLLCVFLFLVRGKFLRSCKINLLDTYEQSYLRINSSRILQYFYLFFFQLCESVANALRS